METQTLSRNYSIDNLKAILMVFVILGHVILNLNHGVELSMLYQFIYIFHMPCFVFISGYLSKGIVKDGKFQANRYFSVLWMYVFFKLIWFVVQYICEGSAKLDFLTVSSAPWYLLALSTWYLLVPLITSVKKKYAIIATLLIGVFSGYVSQFSTFLSISRVLVFLPFFTMGLLLEKEQLEEFTKRNLRIPATIILSIIIVGFVLLREQMIIISPICYGEYPYEKTMGELAAYGALIRGVVFLFAILITMCLLAIVPKRKMFFSYVGKNTMAVYVLHVLIRNVMNYLGVFTWINEKYSKSQMILVIPIAIIATLVLGNPIFGRIFRFISNPLQMILKKN